MKLQIKCDWCGKVFERKPGSVKERNYCSKACLGRANAERYRVQSLKTCDNCGREFEYRGHHRSRNRHFFCCAACGYAFKIKTVQVRCDWCGAKFTRKRSDVERNQHNFCDVGCYLDYINFEKAGAPNQKVAGKILYRTIAERNLGRPLKDDEEVHHIDGNHLNNSPDNLQVLSASEHSVIHASQKERDSLGRFTKQK